MRIVKVEGKPNGGPVEQRPFGPPAGRSPPLRRGRRRPPRWLAMARVTSLGDCNTRAERVASFMLILQHVMRGW